MANLFIILFILTPFLSLFLPSLRALTWCVGIVSVTTAILLFDAQQPSSGGGPGDGLGLALLFFALVVFLVAALIRIGLHILGIYPLAMRPAVIDNAAPRSWATTAPRGSDESNSPSTRMSASGGGRWIVAAVIATPVACLVWTVVALHAPTDEEALSISVARTGLKALTLAVAVDPSMCRVRGRVPLLPGGGGRVECLNFPRHLFVDKVQCDAAGQGCRPIIVPVPECMDYTWNMSLFADPSSGYPGGPRTHTSLSTGSSACDGGWTIGAVRHRLAELGLRLDVERLIEMRHPSRK